MRKYYDDSENKIEYITTAPMWETVNNYKTLLDYYKNNHFSNRLSDEQIRARIRYILDNGIKQRDEVATLYWVLGEEDTREEKTN